MSVRLLGAILLVQRLRLEARRQRSVRRTLVASQPRRTLVLRSPCNVRSSPAAEDLRTGVLASLNVSLQARAARVGDTPAAETRTGVLLFLIVVSIVQCQRAFVTRVTRESPAAETPQTGDLLLLNDMNVDHVVSVSAQ